MRPAIIERLLFKGADIGRNLNSASLASSFGMGRSKEIWILRMIVCGIFIDSSIVLA